MSAQEIATGLIVGLIIERPARNEALDETADRLERAGTKIADRIRRGSPKQFSVRQVRHITGIERWCQRRLRVALGEPPVLDEYDGYQPPADASWDALLEAWESTRRETVELTRKLARRPIDDVRVRHNQLGPLSVRGWLRYLSQHANRESLGIR